MVQVRLKESGTKVKLQECVGIRTNDKYKDVLCVGIKNTNIIQNTGLLKPILKNQYNKPRTLQKISIFHKTVAQIPHNCYLV